jgi:hypothetical protein
MWLVMAGLVPAIHVFPKFQGFEGSAWLWINTWFIGGGQILNFKTALACVLNSLVAHLGEHGLYLTTSG